jgi:DNA-binding GntR family transcriptional regulator
VIGAGSLSARSVAQGGLSQDIRARTLTPQEAELLDDRPGAGSLQIIRRYFDAANQIYLISINNYRSHEFVYNLRLQLR